MGLDVASYLGQSSIYIINLAIVYYLRYSFSLSSTAIGLAASTYTITYFIGCLLLPPVVAKLKSSSSIMIAIISMALCAVGIISTYSVPLIYILLGIYGLAMSFLWGPMEAWITHSLEGKALNKAVGGFCFSWSFGMALSPVFTTMFAAMGIKLAFCYAALRFAIMFILVFILSRVKITETVIEEGKEEVEVSQIAPVSLRFASRSTVFLVYAVLTALQNIFPLYAGEVLGRPESWSGLMLFLRGFSSCLFFLYISRSSWWQFNIRITRAFMAALAVLCILPVFFSSTAFLSLFFIVFGLAFVIGFELSIFHCSAGRKDRTKIMMFHEGMLNIGSVFGAMLGGLLYDRSGFAGVMTGLSLSVILTLGISFAVGVIIRNRNA